MAQTKFGSQIVPKDSTEKTGFMFFPVSAVPILGLIGNATYAAISAGAPVGVQASETTAATIVSMPLMVPYDLDTSETCYASVGIASMTTATTATATMALTYQDIAAGSTIVAPAVTCGSFSTMTVAATTGYFTYSSSAAMSTKPTPGNLLAFKLILDPLVEDSHVVYGIKMQYTRRFV